MAAADEEDLQGYEIYYAEMVGSGSFGYVYEARNRDGKTVAVKVIRFKEHAEKDIKNAQKCLHLQNKHPNIVDIYDVLHNKYIFMEYCEFGNLRKFFNRRVLTTKEKVELMSQIADGIAHLHANDIIHRDINPENILIQKRVDGFPVVKLSDFGVSKFIDKEEQSAMSSEVGTLAFRAPEFWRRSRDGKLHYKRGVDVFAAGLTFLAMLQTGPDGNLSPGIEVRGSLDATEQQEAIGYTMYVRMKNNQAIPNLISDDGDDMTKQVKQLIKRMLHVDSDKRVNASSVSTTLHGILLQNVPQ